MEVAIGNLGNMAPPPPLMPLTNGPVRQSSIESADSYAGDDESEHLEPLTPATCDNTNLLAEVTPTVISDLLHMRSDDHCRHTYVGHNILITLASREQEKECRKEDFMHRQIFEAPAHPYGFAEFVSNRVINASAHTLIISCGNSQKTKNDTSRKLVEYLMPTFAGSNSQNEHGMFLKKIDAVSRLFSLLGSKSIHKEDVNMSLFHLDVFTNVSGTPIGASITSFLLDRPSVSENQSNFSILYTLASLAPPKIKEGLFLTPTKAANDYAILKTSSKPDFAPFKTVEELLATIGFVPEQITEVWQALACVIHFGEMKFAADGTGCKITNNERVEHLSALLKVSQEDIASLFVSKSPSEAENCNGTIINTFYSSLYHGLITKANEFIQVRESKLEYGRLTNVSLIDSPVFQTSGHLATSEKLAVNFLQDLYAHLMADCLLRQKQALYLKDCLEWVPIEYKTHLTKLEALVIGTQKEASVLSTIFAHLAKESLEPRQLVSDLKKSFGTDSILVPKEKTFIVRHTLGEVEYDASSLTKHQDSNGETEEKLTQLLSGCSNQFLLASINEGFEMGKDRSVRKNLVTAACESFAGLLTSLQRYSTSLVTLACQRREAFFLLGLEPNAPDAKSNTVANQIEALNIAQLTIMAQRGYVLSMGYSNFLRRYKMLTQYTWPAFNGRSDLHGILVMLYILGLTDTCHLGRRMIHVQSIETLAQLEHMRSVLLPAVIKFLQKMWRGALARQRYKIFYAMFKIVRKFRAWKFKIYLLTLIRRFSGVREMRDFGKSLDWPEAPFILRRFHIKLYNTFRRWRLRQRLKTVQADEWPQIKCKIAALEIIGNKRDLGLNRQWSADYLALGTENPQSSVYVAAMNSMMYREDAGAVIFSSIVKKLGSRGKTTERAVVFCEHQILKLDHKKEYRLLKTIEMADVTEISVTSGDDQLVVIHTNDEYDIAMTLENSKKENRVPELLGSLRMAIITAGETSGTIPREVKITVQKPPINFIMSGSQHVIDVEEADESQQENKFRKESGAKRFVLQAPPPSPVTVTNL